MENQEKKWYGWKDIEIDKELIGDTIEKGSGVWVKEYCYINIPDGHGYDNYSFLLSANCVHYAIKKESHSYFSIADDMNIELVYNPEKRETEKRYKRYKMTGYELFENIFKEYEINFKEASRIRLEKERLEKEKREKNQR